MKVHLLNLCSCFSFCSFCLFNISILLGINEIVTLLAVVCSLPYVFYFLYYSNWRLNRYFFILLFFMALGAFLNVFVTDNGLGGVLVILGVLSLSLFSCHYPRLIYRGMYVVLLIYLGICFYKILYLGIDPNEFYVGMSRNYLGLILVAYNILYCFLGYVLKLRVNIVISILSLVLSVMLVGRSTIGAMIALFLLNWCFYFKKKSFLLLLTLFLFVFALWLYWGELVDLYKASSFGGFGFDTPRYVLWGDFFKYANFFTYILGIDTFSIPSIAQYEGNTHNGYLNILARTGFGVWAFLIVYFYSIYRYLRDKKYYVIGLLLILSGRVFFDTGMFINNLGFTFYILILYPCLIVNGKLSDGYTDFNVNNESSKYS